MIDEFAHELDEIRHWFVDHASKQARVQILTRTGHVDGKVGDPA